MAIPSSTSADAPARGRIQREPGGAGQGRPSAEPSPATAPCPRAANSSVPSAARAAEHDARCRTERHRGTLPPGEISGPPLEPKRHGWSVRRVDEDETPLEVSPEQLAPAV